MERAQLMAMTLEELRHLAEKRGVAAAGTLDRASLIEALAESRPSRPGEPASFAEPRPATVMPSSVLPSRPSDYDSETMARMYLEQGLFERALEILRELVAACPGDARLAHRLAEAERMAAESQPRRRPPSAPPHPPPTGHEPMGMLDFEELPEAYGVDEVEVLFKDPYSVFAYWEVTDAGMHAARAHLGDEAGDARLILRLFSSLNSGDLTHTRDYFIDQWRGRRYLPSPKAGVRLRAATGLVAPSGLFSLIANSSVLRVPPADAAQWDPTAVEWMEVRPGRTRGLERERLEIVRKMPSSESPVRRWLDLPGGAWFTGPAAPGASGSSPTAIPPPSSSPRGPFGPGGSHGGEGGAR